MKALNNVDSFAHTAGTHFKVAMPGAMVRTHSYTDDSVSGAIRGQLAYVDEAAWLRAKSGF